MPLDALLAAERTAAAQPRARGEARVVARCDGGETWLARLYQAGSARALTPRGADPGLACVLLNTAGGVTGGDRFAAGIEAGAGARVSVSTQAAERAYRAQPGETGTIRNRLTLARGARIDWLPQETILFDGARLDRRLEVEMAGDATLLAVEAVILGRPAMGERVTNLHFADRWRIRRDGRLVYADALRLTGDAADMAARAAVLGGAGAFASLVYVAPDADQALGPLRALLGGDAGASLIRPGVLAARFAAPTGFDLRRELIPAVEHLRGARLPAVWRL